MSYDPPTYAEFIARFPIFADKEQPVVEALLLEATNTVDTNWIEQDYKPAILYLAAHLVATDNSDEGDDVTFGPVDGRQVVGESFGGMSVNYAQRLQPDPQFSANFSSTEYGRRFLNLLRSNRPAVVVI